MKKENQPTAVPREREQRGIHSLVARGLGGAAPIGMKCKQAELLIMHHFEKTIEPADATKLAKHVMECEACRELYLVLDEGMEFAAEEAELPPVDFTESVMDKVRELPVYVKPVAKADISEMVLRVLWGFSAIILGVVLFFIFNPDTLASLSAAYPVVNSVIGALASMGATVAVVFEWVSQDGVFAAGDMGIAALLFVGVMGALLYVLHNGEKSLNT